ncbi:unnamed protein product [Periconia digitata]|uniref:Uncharacterized protein n=1 Tax=Periconia digitata TaxID=1303443 RepID=A0A9W4UWN1_9PLEO|nr:unnamed protein product [Periconia digitata]
MAGPQYSIEQLQHLRESPLVKKPDDLPSISQWMDVPADSGNENHNNVSTNAAGVAARRPRANVRGGDAAAEALNNPMGQFARRQSMQPGEDTVLGPPKFNFASATRAHKHKDSATAITSTDGEHLGDRFPKADRAERWRDREGDRNREKGHLNGRRAAREDGESWTGAGMKGRKSLGQDDFDRGFGRNGDRDADNGDGSVRRVGNARWGRREDTTAKDGDNARFGAAGQGGWRDRERNREREKDRDWNRGGNKEEDPEWMDAPIEKKESKQHTQEDFQRWLEQSRASKGGKVPVEEREEPRADVGQALEEIPATVTEQTALKMAVNTPTLEPNLGNMFGTWGKEKPAESMSADPAPPKAKAVQKSRFMTMFAKPEEPSAPLPIPSAAPSSPGPVPEASADQEGFNRILQMLATHNIASPSAASPAPSQQTNDTRQGGVALDFPHYSPPPQDVQKQRAPPPQPSRTTEQQALIENILSQRHIAPESRPPQQGRISSMSPDNGLNELFRAPRAEPKFLGDEYPMQQPPRNHNMQDPNLAAILNNRPREDANRERESKEFLLTLMQQPRNTPPQMPNHNLPRQQMESQNLAFFDQPGQQRLQGQPKGRGGPPPGFMEDPRLFENEMLRREAEHRQHQMREFQQQEAMRNKNRGMPMGFPGQEDPAIAGLQRRNTAGEIPRQLTNMGIPSQPHPEMPFMGGGRQPGMPPTPQDRPNIAPPPGFGMRQPPGLGPQQQQMGPVPSFSAGNTPLGHPPGFPPPPPGNMARPNFPGGPQGGAGNGMQGPPPPMQGYFPPPGYGPPPPMQMRGDERMMFEPQFGGGPGGPRQQQPGRPGPPPNMY